MEITLSQYLTLIQKRLDKKHEKLISKLQEKYNCEREEVLAIIRSPFEFIRETTKKLNFTCVSSEEELIKMKTNFNIPRIGKLYANFNNIKKQNHVRNSKGQDTERER